MNEQFRNSPLVEVVAEIHWDTGVKKRELIMQTDALEEHEEFFKRLIVKTTAAGFVSSERLIPHGFPLPCDVPVFRFKKSANGSTVEERAKQLSTLFQAGIGLFTINAIQPYSCWDDFINDLRVGINALLSSNPPMEELGFEIVVKYMDAFGPSLVGERNLREFMQNCLGIEVKLPKVFEVSSTSPISGESEFGDFSIVTPLEFGVYTIQFNKGKVSGSSALLMQNSVKINDKVEADVESIIAEMTSARNVIHNNFIEMTKPLHEVMGVI